MIPTVFDIFSDMCASSVCLVVVVIIAFIVFICAVLWRASGRKKVEVHTTTVEKSGRSGRYCPKCGREIPFDSKICPYCKKDFDE